MRRDAKVSSLDYVSVNHVRGGEVVVSLGAFFPLLYDYCTKPTWSLGVLPALFWLGGDEMREDALDEEEGGKISLTCHWRVGKAVAAIGAHIRGLFTHILI